MIQDDSMEKLIKIFHSNHGYARMKYLREVGIQTRDIANAVNDGILEKIKPGLYKLVNYPWDEFEGFVDICNANTKAVICLLSAAAHWELTTFDPNRINVAVPRRTDKFKLDYPPMKVYYFGEKTYLDGIEEINTKNGIFKIYNREKTICDLFRYQKKIGEDIVIEALKTYIRNKRLRSIPKLLAYAKTNNVEKKIKPLLKGML